MTASGGTPCRLRRSHRSSIEHFGTRRYCGGWSEAKARNTVFLEIASCRALAACATGELVDPRGRAA
ncbi:hypothetical protein, partial [Streptomyces chiangmaiensis]